MPLKAIDFPDRNVIIGDNQPEYVSLPACRLPLPDAPDVVMDVSCWELTSEQIEEITRTGKIYLAQMHHKQAPYQPSILVSDKSEIISYRKQKPSEN